MTDSSASELSAPPPGGDEFLMSEGRYPIKGQVDVVRLAPGGRWLAASTDDGRVCCWDLGENSPTGEIQQSGLRVIDFVGDRLLVSQGGAIELRRCPGLEVEHRIDGVRAASVARQYNQLLGWTANDEPALWALPDFTLVEKIKSDPSAARTSTFMEAAGGRVYTRDGSTIWILDAGNRQAPHPIRYTNGRLTCIALCAEPFRLAVGTEGGSLVIFNMVDRVMDIEKGVEMGAPIDSLAFSPCGTLLAVGVGSGDDARVDLLHTAPGPGEEGTVGIGQVSALREVLGDDCLTYGPDGWVRGTLPHLVEVAGDRVTAIAFDAVRRRVYSGQTDRVMVWSAANVWDGARSPATTSPAPRPQTSPPSRAPASPAARKAKSIMLVVIACLLLAAIPLMYLLRPRPQGQFTLDGRSPSGSPIGGKTLEKNGKVIARVDEAVKPLVDALGPPSEKLSPAVSHFGFYCYDLPGQRLMVRLSGRPSDPTIISIELRNGDS